MGSSQNVMTALAVSWLDRMVAQDVTRASIVLSKLAEIWPDFKDSYITERGGNPAQYPNAIPYIWDGITRQIVSSALPTGSATVEALRLQIAGTEIASQVRQVGQRYLEYIPAGSASRAFAARVAGADISGLPQMLDSLISGIVAQSAIPGTNAPRFSPSIAQIFNSPAQRDLLRQALVQGIASGRVAVGSMDSNPAAGGGAIIDLPGTTITGRLSEKTLGMPTWAWLVGGTVLVAGVGIFVYRRYYSKSPP